MKFPSLFNNLASMSCYISGLFKISAPPPPAGAEVFERLCWLHHRVESVAPIFERIRPNFPIATALDLLNLRSSVNLDNDAVHAAYLNVLRELKEVQLISKEELLDASMAVNSARDMLAHKDLRSIYIAKFVTSVQRKEDAKEGREEARRICEEWDIGMLWFHPSFTKEDKGGQEGDKEEL